MIVRRRLIELPKDVTLDGELFGRRGEFQITVGIVKTMGSKGWRNITFQVRLGMFFTFVPPPTFLVLGHILHFTLAFFLLRGRILRFVLWSGS